MLTSSGNYTVDDLGISLRFVFSQGDNDFPASRLGVGFGFTVVALVFFGAIAFPALAKNAKDLVADSFICTAALIFLPMLSINFVETFWRLKGEEIVEIDDNLISICHQVFGLKITKKISSKKISCIFISRPKKHWFPDVSRRDFKFISFTYGKIAFNYGKVYFNIENTLFGEINTIRFGSILSQDESKSVLALIHQKFPQYKCPAKNIVKTPAK